MATRETLLRKFGPKLLEALCIVLLQEVNRLRQEVLLPPLTEDDVLTEIETVLETLPDYEWMENGT